MAKKVLIAFNGTRGDVQPYVVAGKILEQGGFEVMLAGPGDAKALAEHCQVKFQRTRLSFQRLMHQPGVAEAMEKDDIMTVATIKEKRVAEHKEEELKAMYELLTSFKPDLVLCGPLCVPDTLALCKIRRIPVIVFCLHRWRPSRYITPVGVSDSMPGGMKMACWKLLLRLSVRASRQLDIPILDRILGFSSKPYYPTYREYCDYIMNAPAFLSLVAESNALMGDLPADFSSNIVQIGALMMPPKEQEGTEFGAAQSSELDRFLEAGPSPVYCGFGSIICKSSKFMTLLCLRGLMMSGQRGVVASSWSDMSVELLEGEPDSAELIAYAKEKVLFMKTAPHGTLFPRCSVIVHHGGSGTSNASVRSGTPTIICPIWFDQFDNSAAVNARGIGVGMQDMRKVKPADLAAAITKCLGSASIKARAREVAEAISKEDSAGKLVSIIKEYMQDFVATGRHLKLQDELLEALQELLVLVLLEASQARSRLLKANFA
eukprot:CAMPEP_0181465462 /NCGR_PEP_ID=MMETSP1110-20121109/35961_1 /TAXON_ID=174948 /ORGANISM="Symbiodinium sp., Strain CCMP421" /LENGTH=489 /DNA_ID=CAMNT_0023590229 /DNA_START=43 /DNA_END=1511 /DNA_ORIENTATION=+